MKIGIVLGKESEKIRLSELGIGQIAVNAIYPNVFFLRTYTGFIHNSTAYPDSIQYVSADGVSRDRVFKLLPVGTQITITI